MDRLEDIELNAIADARIGQKLTKVRFNDLWVKLSGRNSYRVAQLNAGMPG